MRNRAISIAAVVIIAMCGGALAAPSTPSSNLSNDFYVNATGAIVKYSTWQQAVIPFGKVEFNQGTFTVSFSELPAALQQQNKQQIQNLNQQFNWADFMKLSQGPNAFNSAYTIYCLFPSSEGSKIATVRPGESREVSVKLRQTQSNTLIFDCLMGDQLSSGLGNVATGTAASVSNNNPQGVAGPQLASVNPPPSPPTLLGAGVDCNATQTWADRQICSNASLLEDDKKLTELFTRKISNPSTSEYSRQLELGGMNNFRIGLGSCEGVRDPFRCLQSRYAQKILTLN